MSSQKDEWILEIPQKHQRQRNNKKWNVSFPCQNIFCLVSGHVFRSPNDFKRAICQKTLNFNLVKIFRFLPTKQFSPALSTNKWELHTMNKSFSCSLCMFSFSFAGLEKKSYCPRKKLLNFLSLYFYVVFSLILQYNNVIFSELFFHSLCQEKGTRRKKLFKFHSLPRRTEGRRKFDIIMPHNNDLVKWKMGKSNVNKQINVSGEKLPHDCLPKFQRSSSFLRFISCRPESRNQWP